MNSLLSLLPHSSDNRVSSTREDFWIAGQFAPSTQSASTSEKWDVQPKHVPGRSTLELLPQARHVMASISDHPCSMPLHWNSYGIRIYEFTTAHLSDFAFVSETKIILWSYFRGEARVFELGSSVPATDHSKLVNSWPRRRPVEHV